MPWSNLVEWTGFGSNSQWKSKWEVSPTSYFDFFCFSTLYIILYCLNDICLCNSLASLIDWLIIRLVFLVFYRWFQTKSVISLLFLYILKRRFYLFIHRTNGINIAYKWIHASFIKRKRIDGHHFYVHKQRSYYFKIKTSKKKGRKIKNKA